MIERKIIIGLITSTEYCSRIKGQWDIKLIESATAKRISSWCWEYFDQYGKAPGADIESIYFTKLKEDRLPKELAEEIEQDILPDLSKESVKDPINVEYLVGKTNEYFAERHATLFNDDIK